MGQEIEEDEWIIVNNWHINIFTQENKPNQFSNISTINLPENQIKNKNYDRLS